MPGDSKQTTTQNSEPWSGAQPGLNAALTGAMQQFNKGLQPYTASMVVPWSPDTTSGMDMIRNNVAGAGGAIQSAYAQTIKDAGLTGDQQNAMRNYYEQVAQGGWTPETRNAASGFMNVANAGGYNDALRNAQGGFQNIVNSGGYNTAQNEAMNNVRSLANSEYSISPELQKVLDAQATKAGEAVNMNAAGAGRYGSGANQTLLAKNVGDLTNSTVYNNYTNFLGRRDAANNNLFSMGQTGQGNVSSALGNISGIGQTAMGNQLSALGSYGNLANQAQSFRDSYLGNIASLGQQGFSNLGTAYSGMNLPATDLMNIGSMNEDLNSRQINDQLRLFEEQQNLPWKNIEKLNAIASGAGSLGGTQRSTQPGQNPFLSGLGYASGGLGLFGSIF